MNDAPGWLYPALLVCLCWLPGCYSLLPSNGGGQTAFTPPRVIEPADVALPPGYVIEAVAQGLTFPSAVAFDDQDRVYVVEAGYSYGPETAMPRMLRIEPDGAKTVIATGDNAPWNGVDFLDGAFYVAQGGHLGRIVRIDLDGEISTLVEDLPSFGDHHTNGPVVGEDGWLYFGQGTATNSGVVGTDNHDFGWLQQFPDFHDVPGEDIILAGRNYITENPLTADTTDTAETGAYVPFGTSTTPGQVIAGRVRCTGSVLRVNPDGGALELVAWGFRNPFGLAFAPGGSLFVTDNGYDRRGSRPFFGAPDLLWEVIPGTWYGWPDFVGGIPATDKRFSEAGNPQPEFVLAKHPNDPPETQSVSGRACLFQRCRFQP